MRFPMPISDHKNKQIFQAQTTKKYLIFEGAGYNFAINLEKVLKVGQISKTEKNLFYGRQNIPFISLESIFPFGQHVSQNLDFFVLFNHDPHPVALPVHKVKTVSELENFQRFSLPPILFTHEKSLFREFLCDGQKAVFLLNPQRFYEAIHQHLSRKNDNNLN